MRSLLIAVLSVVASVASAQVAVTSPPVSKVFAPSVIKAELLRQGITSDLPLGGAVGGSDTNLVIYFLPSGAAEPSWSGIFSPTNITAVTSAAAVSKASLTNFSPEIRAAVLGLIDAIAQLGTNLPNRTRAQLIQQVKTNVIAEYQP